MRSLRNLLPLLSVLFLGCAENSRFVDSDIQYKLSEPDAVYKLPKKLNEISGLSYLGDGKLACVQDEKGNIYVFDMESEELSTQIDFGKNNDYEGVTFGDGSMFVLQSNGTVYEVSDFEDEQKRKTEKYPTFLKSKNNTEGICYDKNNNRLLIACKDDPGKDMSVKDMVAIYSFDLKTRKLETKPAYLIRIDSVRAFTKRNNLRSTMDMSFNKAPEQRIIRPSGIAIHPITNNIYVISTVGKILIILKPDGSIESVAKLPIGICGQPEGITFDELGNMYISNERRSAMAPANILRFNRQVP